MARTWSAVLAKSFRSPAGALSARTDTWSAERRRLLCCNVFNMIRNVTSQLPGQQQLPHMPCHTTYALCTPTTKHPSPCYMHTVRCDRKKRRPKPMQDPSAMTRTVWHLSLSVSEAPPALVWRTSSDPVLSCSRRPCSCAPQSDDSERAAPFGRGRGIVRSWDAVESQAVTSESRVVIFSGQTWPPLLPQPSGGRCTATESSPRCRSALWGPPWTARAAALRALRSMARSAGATSGSS